jgi:hypothetical protein
MELDMWFHHKYTMRNSTWRRAFTWRLEGKKVRTHTDTTAVDDHLNLILFIKPSNRYAMPS